MIISEMFFATLGIFVVYFVEIQGEWCNIRSSHGWSTDNIVYCDSFWEKCCDRGCCSLKSLDQITVWIIVAVSILCVVLCCCYRNMCGSKVNNTRNSNIFQNTPQPTRNQQINSRPPEVILSLPLQQGERDVPISYIHPVTPPPSYEIVMSAPPLNPDDRIPSYADVMRGK